MEANSITVPIFFENNKKCLVFASNDNYAPYLCVALFSLRKHIANEVYDICILHSGLSVDNQHKISELQQNNFAIRFVDVRPILASIDENIFITHAHFSKEAYYRFFIPKIFINYEKVIYLDCDMLFLDGLHELFHINLQDKAMAAVLEYKFKCKVEYTPMLMKYAKNVLNLVNVQNYFNSGMLVFDIKALNDIDFTEKCLETLLKVQRPRTVDQCIINSIMQNNVLFIDAAWNLQTHVDIKELKQFVPLKDYASYMEAFLKPKVIHYCSPLKPWNSSDIPFAELWLDYAKQGGYCECSLHE